MKLKAVTLLRWFVLAAGVIAAAFMTIWPTLKFTVIQPTGAYRDNPGAVSAELLSASLGTVFLSLPCLLYFWSARKRSPLSSVCAAVLLLSLVAFSHLSVHGGNSTAAIAYLFLLPIQFLSIPFGYWVGRLMDRRRP